MAQTRDRATTKRRTGVVVVDIAKPDTVAPAIPNIASKPSYGPSIIAIGRLYV